MRMNNYDPDPATPTPAVPPGKPMAAGNDVYNGYPGSKAASGVAERIIREMPFHNVYVEAFAGHAAVFRRKRPAKLNLLYDIDPCIVARLENWFSYWSPRTVVSCADTLRNLFNIPFINDATTLLYCDPPYLMETRTRLVYAHEFEKPEQHRLLLSLLQSLTCMVMVSGYRSELYDDVLERWRRIDIPAMTRGGPRTECLWCNFAPPTILHDSRFAGADYRERDRLKKKAARWQAKFNGMPATERQVIAAALANVDRAAMNAAMEASKPLVGEIDSAAP